MKNANEEYQENCRTMLEDYQRFLWYITDRYHRNSVRITGTYHENHGGVTYDCMKNYGSLDNNPLKVMEGQSYNSPTPFDDTFRTECVRMTEWLIPLINEAYGTTYDEHAKVILRDNEQLMFSAVDADDLGQNGIPKKITDTNIEIDDYVYHLECQADEDGTILIRLVEYDLYIAANTAVYDKDTDKIIVQIPRSVVIYLRRDKRKEPMTVEYQYGEQQMEVSIPTISVQSYTLEEIFDKKLYFLIPYYFMRYEDTFNRGIGLEDEQIRADVEQLLQRLIELRQKNAITEVQVSDLVELTQTILKQITRKLDDEKRERIVKSMRGRVLEMESDKLIERGITIGEERGRLKGLREGILQAMHSLQESYSEDEVYTQLKKLFGLTDEETAQYMKMG